jgi:Putative peptidoglycan binding domain
MTQTKKSFRLVIFPAMFAILALCLGAGVASANAQKKHVKKSTKHSSHAKGAHIRAARERTSTRRRYSRRRRPRGQRVPTKDRISEIQDALAKDGSYTGEPTGKWDDHTVEAMRKFQAAHGLNPSGKIDALSLEKLGLGSETAGIAAPLPPVNLSSTDPATGQPQTAERQ